MLISRRKLNASRIFAIFKISKYESSRSLNGWKRYSSRVATVTSPFWMVRLAYPTSIPSKYTWIGSSSPYVTISQFISVPEQKVKDERCSGTAE